ncbi:fatty acid desaturase [Rhizobium sp. NFR03]|uniref:fatty acid desaturase n=1 Tax=Rhizobium sp. NFR03 TaxID=1566263 RepID=UPI0008CA13D3|nr:fatty acid desaturase [Rhizobium sp. NFR03]SER70004.1 Fatty acid desaturase [Rhizobium sp. NFR03]
MTGTATHRYTPPTALLSAKVEWPTVLLAVGLHGGFLAVTWWWAVLPLPLVVVIGGLLIAWHASLQHEVIHHHPTRSRRINDAIGSVPLSLWLPYPIYKDSHLDHHRDEFLTDPVEDPESSYVTQAVWLGLGRTGKRLAQWNLTLLGRLTIGPAVMLGSFLAGEARFVWRNEVGRRSIWALHALGVAIVLTWVVAICGMPFWLYFFGFVYPGAAITRLRSYAEHRFAEAAAERTAIVENSRIFGPVFLFNNLHVLHHRKPGLPWYRLPAIYRRDREALVAANGGLVYNGYLDVARRFLLRPHDRITHPHHSG